MEGLVVQADVIHVVGVDGLINLAIDLLENLDICFFYIG